MSGLRLIIEHHPAWTTPPRDTDSLTRVAANDTHASPVLSTVIYMLLGRRGTQWHTIIPRIDQADDAIAALDAANRSQLFDRLVITAARTMSGQPVGPWQTFACAVPPALLQPLPPKSFADMLDRAERRQSTLTLVPSLPQPAPAAVAPVSSAVPVRADKQDAKGMLAALVLLSIWNQTYEFLAGVAILALFEALYQSGWLDWLIPASQARFVRTGRIYLYALCAGMMALPLVVNLLLKQ